LFFRKQVKIQPGKESVLLISEKENHVSLTPLICAFRGNLFCSEQEILLPHSLHSGQKF
jgi:hypothetical protein